LTGDEAEGGGPLELGDDGQFGEADGDGEQAVDEAVEVGEGVGVEVVDDVDGVLGGDAFVALDFVGTRTADLVQQQFALHEVVVARELSQFCADAAVLLSHELVEALLDLVEDEHEELAVLQLQRFDVVLEVVGRGELGLELVAPLG
jgi:hypothetical protein